MTDRECLIWIHQRLIKVHKEHPYVDYMHRLRDVIYGMPKDKKSISDVATMHSTKIYDEIKNLQDAIMKRKEGESFDNYKEQGHIMQNGDDNSIAYEIIITVRKNGKTDIKGPIANMEVMLDIFGRALIGVAKYNIQNKQNQDCGA